jgi:hypothetical protein
MQISRLALVFVTPIKKDDSRSNQIKTFLPLYIQQLCQMQHFFAILASAQ